VVACNSREFLADCRDKGRVRPGDEDRRGETDLRPFSASSTDGVSDVELLCLAEEFGDI